MKRSEMIAIMDKVINASDEDLNKLLKVMEEAGMLPPFTYLKTLGTLDTAWEPEDE